MSDYKHLICDHLNATGFKPPGEHAAKAKWFIGFMIGDITYGVPLQLAPPDWAADHLKAMFDSHARGFAFLQYPQSTAINEGK